MNKSGGLRTNNRFDSLKSGENRSNSFARTTTRYREDARPVQDATPQRTRGTYGSQTRGSYAPPQARNRKTSSNFFVTPKKEPKKEFSASAEMFPTIGNAEPKKEPEAPPSSELGFVAALKRKKKTKKKWQGTRMEAKPGWVVLYYDESGRMQREYGEGASETVEPPLPNRAAILGAMVARWQERRDYLNETHGQLSPYYGLESLLDDPGYDCYDDWGDSNESPDDQADDYDDGDY